MNRTGQPPQRPPSLGPNPTLGAFRGPFPNYGMPPRNVMPGYPQMANHRTAQGIVPQPSPNYLQQQRGQNNFPFAGTLQQQQQSQAPSQHTAQTPLPHTPLQPQPPQSQQPSSNASANLPPHLTQNPISNLGTAPSASSTSEVGLDPNDFPALGSTPANLGSSATSNAASYATQAGNGVGVAGNGAQGASGAANQQRDFTPDDFPALGGSQTSQATQQATNTDGHPPGLNGFQQGDHRQSLLGQLTGGQQQPGVLNLGQARGVHAGFQSEADKRNYALKLNQNNLAAAAAAWNSPNANPGSQQQQGASAYPTANGAHANHVPPNQQTPGQQQPPQQSQQHLGAPPGVPPPHISQQQGQQGLVGTPYAGNGAVDTPHQGSAQTSAAVPQTPAQQVLMSPADKWGLLGLLAIIKSTDPDTNLLSVGTDLGTMGLDMQTSGSLYSTFITPWADSSAAHTVEPDFHLPSCYNVQPPPPGPQKVAAFSDETLFFMFYSSPRDALQELAAQELYNRNWRYHKELRLWITKEQGTSPSAKVPGGEQGTYSYWDPENWEKSRKVMTVLYADLEEKGAPVFAPGPTLQLASSTSSTTPANGWYKKLVPAADRYCGYVKCSVACSSGMRGWFARLVSS
ncbi:hypothetical protein K474DRAFT_1691207 [Panus rudis PR-1116 ss-1]|nr:hypothetical protein K474DRAFT_1691207 [Panus rudis PR-1116 ss-1]